MKKKYKIEIAYNPEIFVHSTTRIVACYSKEYFEVNEKYEKMSEGEYIRLMQNKIGNAKTQKEKDTLYAEYLEILEKYYPIRGKYITLSYNEDVSKLDGYIMFKIDTVEEHFNLPLLDYISYHFNNINDYYLFFINNLNYFADKLYDTDLKKIEFYKLYKIQDILKIAKKYYYDLVENLIKEQKMFKDCIDFCYGNRPPISLDMLTFQQRFFVYNQLYHYPLKQFASDFETVNLLDYTYDTIPYNPEVVDPRDIIFVSGIVKGMDEDGSCISSTNKYITSNFFTVMFIYMFNILGKQHLFIKECGNCKKYFITQKENVSYCDRVIKDNLTCKDIGNKEYKKRKQEKEPVYNKYRNILSKKSMRASRNPDIDSYKKDYEDFKKKAQKYLNDIKEGKTTIEKFEKWLDKQT